MVLAFDTVGEVKRVQNYSPELNEPIIGSTIAEHMAIMENT